MLCFDRYAVKKKTVFGQKQLILVIVIKIFFQNINIDCKTDVLRKKLILRDVSVIESDKVM